MSRKKSLSGFFIGLKERIRAIRGEITQSEFGKMIGVTQGTVWKYETGRVPDRETLEKIADFGEITIEELLYGKKDQESYLPTPDEALALESPETPSLFAEPFLFGALDIDALTKIIENMEEVVKSRKKRPKPVKYALLLSLLYDQFQKTGRIPDQATVKEFLRRVD